MDAPDRAALDEHDRLSAALLDATERDPESAETSAARAALKRHTISHGMGDGGFDPDAAPRSTPAPPFTPDERAQLNLLLLETKLSGDEAGFGVLRELAADPARYRAFMADRPAPE